MTDKPKTKVSSTELVEAMCEAAAEHPDWANQSQMEAALSVARPIIERELLMAFVNRRHELTCEVVGEDFAIAADDELIENVIKAFARERGIEIGE